MNTTSTVLISLALTLIGASAWAAEPTAQHRGNSQVEIERTVDFGRPTEFTINWEAAPTDLAQRDHALQALIKQGFEVAIRIENDEDKKTERVGYTLSRNRIQSRAELDDLLARFIEATQGRGKVSSRLTQHRSL